MVQKTDGAEKTLGPMVPLHIPISKSEGEQAMFPKSNSPPTRMDIVIITYSTITLQAHRPLFRLQAWGFIIWVHYYYIIMTITSTQAMVSYGQMNKSSARAVININMSQSMLGSVMYVRCSTHYVNYLKLTLLLLLLKEERG